LDNNKECAKSLTLMLISDNGIICKSYLR